MSASKHKGPARAKWPMPEPSLLDKAQSLQTAPVVIQHPESWEGVPTHYCPGCGHGLIHRLVANALDDLGIRERTVGVAGVGCAILIYNYLDVDFQELPHGRAPAGATGIKRVRPDLVVFTYQGDGDLAAIGTAEIVHAAARSENITVIYVNNCVYGMTGGQMAPTTLVGQRSETSPEGRDPALQGHPIKVSEMLATLDGAVYLERVSVTHPENVKVAYRAVRKAFTYQLEGRGFSLVEFLSPCPTNWGMKPVDAMRWIDETVSRYYPLGVIKDQEPVHLAHLVEQPPTAFREDYMHGFRYETVTHATEDELGRPTRRPHPFGRRGGRWVSVDGTDYEPADHDEEEEPGAPAAPSKPAASDAPAGSGSDGPVGTDADPEPPEEH
ncbi:MAG: thiamine pyrophosphate-dependent enzyme [Thermoleophilia bacterium]